MIFHKHLRIYTTYDPVTSNYLRLCYVDFQFTLAFQAQHISFKNRPLFTQKYIKDRQEQSLYLHNLHGTNINEWKSHEFFL